MTFLRLIVTMVAIAACNSPAAPVELDAEVPLTDAHPEGVIYAFGTPTQKLFPNVAATTVFGTAVAIEQDTLVIGATVESNNQGRLYVFVRSGTTWVLQQKLQASDATNGVRLGIQVDISGNTLIAGAAGEAGNPQQGAAYVFTRSGTTWTQQQKITAPDGQPQDRFGQSVRLSGNTAVIGAPGDDDQGSNAGSSYVFVRSGTTWSQQQKLVAADGAANDQFGYGVTIEGDTVAIGSRRDDDGATDAGSVYVFTRSGTTWSQQQKLTSDSGNDGNFGRDLSLSKDTLLIGALQRSGGNGAAYVFVRSGTTWSQQAKLTASDGANQDFFGADVSLFGDTAAVGARLDDDGGTNTGSIYLFKRSGTTWTQTEKLKPADGQADDRFSQDFDLFGTTLVGGSRGDDDLANASGAAYVFESPIVTNGSFETADYTGWTLLETPADPAAGTFGIASEGQVIGPSSIVHDFADNVDNTQSSPGLPITYDATDGTSVALNLQTTSQNHRMFQTITLPAGCGSHLRWDMAYHNHNAAIPAFDPISQFFAINVRDPSTDAILATPFQTLDPAPAVVSAMTPFEVDLSAFDGQTIRLDFEHQVQSFFFDIAWDNIRVACTVPVAPAISISPSPHDFGNQPINTTSANQTFTITNTGTADLVINAVTTSAPFEVTPGSLPATVIPGANVTFTGRFSPTATGTANGTISIASNVSGSPTLVAVTGTGTEPTLSVAPSPHDFGNQPINTTSANQTFTITNTGTADLVITSISTSAPFAVTPGTLPATVTPGNNRTFTGRFSPTATGTANGTISIASNVSGSPTLVSVTGTGTAPAISVSPSPHDFGDQRVNTTSANQTFTITNTGTANLVITSISTSAPFAVTPGTLPSTVTPGNNRTFTGRFSPTATGTANGTISIASNVSGSPTLVSVTGNGTAPAFSIAPSSHDFGSQRVGTTSAGKTFTITNTGTATLNVSAITTTGPFATTNTTFAIAPSASQNLSVTFGPTAVGLASGTLLITHDAAGSPTTVNLSGTGIQPAISLSPSPLAFGTQRVGTTSGGITLTISNPGTDTLNISTITTTGPFATANTPISVPAGGSQAISVTFTPSVGGVASGSVVLTHDAPGSPSSVVATGTGVEPQLDVTPGSLAFGDQRVGTTSGARTFDISNPGTSDLTITAITVGAPFATTNTFPIVVGAGSSTTISVTFAPQTAGAASDTISITSDAASGTNTVAVSGTGVEPVIAVSDLNVGDVRIGTTGNAALAVTNTGSATLTLTSLVATAPFDTTESFPIVIAPSESKNLNITFSPSASGTANDTLTIASDASTSPTTVNVTGRGVEPLATPDLASIEFGLQRVGVTSVTRSVVLTNTGTSPLAVGELITSAPFAVLTSGGSTLQPSQSLTIDVTFTPSVVGIATQTLAIAHDATGAPTTITLTGTGTLAELEASPATLAFGDIRIGTTSTSQQVTIRNLGLAPLTITAITPSAGFVVSGLATPDSVLPNASVTFDVAFTPGAAGPANGTIEIATPVGAATVVVGGAAVASALTADRTTLDLGTVQLGEASEVQLVRLTNDTDAPVTIGSSTLSDPQFVLDPAPSTAPIPPGGSIMLGVRFVPGNGGAALGQVDVSLVGETTVEVSIQLTGRGLVDEGGCCSTGGGGGSSSLLLGLVVLGVLVPRRRRR